MKVKANPQGHRHGVGEVRTRNYTDVGWRNRERGAARMGRSMHDAALRAAQRAGRGYGWPDAPRKG